MFLKNEKAFHALTIFFLQMLEISDVRIILYHSLVLTRKIVI